jgi:hypothetical protein
LFFTTELFHDLVTSAFVTLPRIYPLVVKRGAPELFRSEVDWQRFTEIAAPYATLITRERALLEAQDGATQTHLADIHRELLIVRSEDHRQ